MANAFHPKNVVVMNERAFQRLSDVEKKALMDAAATAEKRGWDLSRQREQSANKMLADQGMSVAEPDAAMKAAFARVGETMLTEWQKSAGAEGDALIKAYRSR